MPLTHQQRELIAVAISVGIGCRPCTSHHIREARRAGGDDAMIEAAIGGALCVRKDAADGIRRYALDTESKTSDCGCAPTDRLGELARLGASLAVNCTSNIGKHAGAARQLGATANEISEVLALVQQIRKVAIGHAEQLVAETSAPESQCAIMARCC